MPPLLGGISLYIFVFYFYFLVILIINISYPKHILFFFFERYPTNGLSKRTLKATNLSVFSLFLHFVTAVDISSTILSSLKADVSIILSANCFNCVRSLPVTATAII